MDCEIHLCSKGFFIVNFSSSEDKDTILKEGPWFWGSTGLFITPWFLEFDANTMEVTKMPVGSGFTTSRFISGRRMFLEVLEISLADISKQIYNEWRNAFTPSHESVWKWI